MKVNSSVIKKAALALSLAAIAGIAAPSGIESWQAKLAKVIPLSKRLKYRWGAEVRPISEARAKLKVTTADPDIYVFENGLIRKISGAEADAWQARQRERQKAIGRALTMIRENNVRSARAILEPLVRENGTDEYAVCTLARAALRQEYFEEALTLLTPLVNDHANEEVLLLAAYAGAMMNKHFEGQQQFCNRITYQAMGGMHGAVPSIPNAPGAAGARQSSLLALASWYAMEGDDSETKLYLRKFLALQARNAWANYVLGGILQREGQWLQASKAFAIAASASSGKLRELAAQERDTATIRAKQGQGRQEP